MADYIWYKIPTSIYHWIKRVWFSLCLKRHWNLFLWEIISTVPRILSIKISPLGDVEGQLAQGPEKLTSLYGLRWNNRDVYGWTNVLIVLKHCLHTAKDFSVSHAGWQWGSWRCTGIWEGTQPRQLSQTEPKRCLYWVCIPYDGAQK